MVDTYRAVLKNDQKRRDLKNRSHAVRHGLIMFVADVSAATDNNCRFEVIAPVPLAPFWAGPALRPKTSRAITASSSPYQSPAASPDIGIELNGVRVVSSPLLRIGLAVPGLTAATAVVEEWP